MLDQLSKFFLLFSHEVAIVPIIIIGFIWVDRRIFYNLLCLTFMSMIINPALKITFKILLGTPMEQVFFVFPSGHMQASVVFYGYLWLKTQNLFLRILILFILTGIALSLVHLEYHDYFDVIGGIFFGAIILWLYSLIPKRYLPAAFVVTASIFVFYIFIIYKIPSHTYLAYYGLVGIILAEALFRSIKNYYKL